MSDSEIIDIIQNGYSINDVCLKVYGYTNGSTIKKAKNFIEENKIDISHFETKNKNRKYNLIEKKCPICDKVFEVKEFHKVEKVTCSNSCANKYFQNGENNPNYIPDLKQKKYIKISETLKSKYKIEKNCLNCGQDISHKPNRKKTKFCSHKCRSSYPVSNETRQKLSDAVKERIKNGKHKGWQSRNIESYPESFFKKVLENNNIEYEFNKTIKKKDLGINCDGNYFLDFYIKCGNIDLEIDGNQHSYRQEHDELRDFYVSNNYNVYRIKWKSINNERGKKYMKEEIDKFLKFYNSLK